MDVAQTLKVPGARLSYDVRGTGPLLLLIPGGAADASIFEALVPDLATQYRVVTYDPRGLSRSPLEGAAADIEVEVQADDAHRLLAAIGAGPAYVFGSSGGAITGLELVARHPEAVDVLIAHEPPLFELLPDVERLRALNADIHATYRRDGTGAALEKFLAMAGFSRPAQAARAAEPDPAADQPRARVRANLGFFFDRMLLGIATYRPDRTALQSAPTRLVVGCGTTSTGQVPYRGAHALAAWLAAPLVVFPGGHADFARDPPGFAAELGRALGPAGPLSGMARAGR